MELIHLAGVIHTLRSSCSLLIGGQIHMLNILIVSFLFSFPFFLFVDFLFMSPLSLISKIQSSVSLCHNTKHECLVVTLVSHAFFLPPPPLFLFFLSSIFYIMSYFMSTILLMNIKLRVQKIVHINNCGFQLSSHIWCFYLT